MSLLFLIFEVQGAAWAGAQGTKEENKTPSYLMANKSLSRILRSVTGLGGCAWTGRRGE